MSALARLASLAAAGPSSAALRAAATGSFSLLAAHAGGAQPASGPFLGHAAPQGRASRGFGSSTVSSEEAAAASASGPGSEGDGTVKGMSREDLLELFHAHNSSLPAIKGTFVEGTVVFVDRKYVHIDVGLKSLLRFFKGQLSTTQIVSSRSSEPRTSQKDFRPGDVFKFHIEELEDPFGDVFANVSKAQTDQHTAAVWRELKSIYENGETVRGRVLNIVNGGFAVGIAGLIAFIPYISCGPETAQKIGVLQEFTIKRLEDATQSIMLEDPKHSMPPAARVNMYSVSAASRALQRQKRNLPRNPLSGMYSPTGRS